MATNHTTSIEIKFGKNTQGFFSFCNPKTLVIFVHGFGGNALNTWTSFPSIVLFEDKFKHCDIIFYGYDTFSGQAGDHAAELYHFVCKAVSPLKSNVLPENQGLQERDYERIVFVAHSLGAVLVRQAQLLACNAGSGWVESSELALFAPAHHGANIISLAMQSLPGVSGLLGLFAKFRFPILSDLDATDDGILKSIKEQTQDLQNSGKGKFSKAKLVVYAKGDKIVRNYNYLQDAPPEVLPGMTHTSVCKPNDAQHRTFDLLKNII